MSSQTFPISTLRDIFNLPTIKQMETCLQELTEGMMQARIASDAMVALLKSQGASDDLVRACEWPEVANWTDDGKGTVGIAAAVPAGFLDFIHNRVGQGLVILRLEASRRARVG